MFAWAATPAHAISRRSGLVDLDLVRHAVDAIQACNVVVGGVTLELIVDIALERDPTVIDLDFDRVGGNLYVRDQALESGATDLVASRRPAPSRLTFSWSSTS